MVQVGGTCQCNETSIGGHGEKCSRATRHVYIRVRISRRIYQAICRHKKRFHADELRLRNCKRSTGETRHKNAIERWRYALARYRFTFTQLNIYPVQRSRWTGLFDRCERVGYLRRYLKFKRAASPSVRFSRTSHFHATI